MTIDFILDISCLWSHIVWRQLKTALLENGADVEIVPFFVPSGAFFAGFDISPADKARMLGERARPLLEENGLYVNFDALPDFSGDIALPCKLIREAFCANKYAVLDEVFAAFFAFGRDITDPAVLKPIAEHNGLAVNTESHSVFSPLPANMPEGLRAVPCLIFNKTSVLFGAQTVPCLKNILHLNARIEKENKL